MGIPANFSRLRSALVGEARQADTGRRAGKPALGDSVRLFECRTSCRLVGSLQSAWQTGSLRRLNYVGWRAPAHSVDEQASRRGPGRLSALGRRQAERTRRLVGQAWQAQVASVPYSLSRLDDRRGWVTKSTLCARAPSGRGGVVVHRDPSALLDGLTFVPLTALSHPQTRRALDRGDNGVRRILPVLKLRPLTRL